MSTGKEGKIRQDEHSGMAVVSLYERSKMPSGPIEKNVFSVPFFP